MVYLKVEQLAPADDDESEVSVNGVSFCVHSQSALCFLLKGCVCQGPWCSPPGMHPIGRVHLLSSQCGQGSSSWLA